MVKTALEIGQLGIANEVDCPESKMVVIITKIEGEEIFFRYLSDEMEQKFKKVGWTHQNEFTLLCDFGVFCEIDGNTFRCQPFQECIAKYPDGKKRRWQELRPNIWHKISNKAYKHI